MSPDETCIGSTDALNARKADVTAVGANGAKLLRRAPDVAHLHEMLRGEEPVILVLACVGAMPVTIVVWVDTEEWDLEAARALVPDEPLFVNGDGH